MASEGVFAEKFIEFCQDTFAPIYRRVSEKFWNNGVYAHARRPYYMCNHDLGLAEYYVPTVLNGEGFMQYHRIVVSVVPELDRETYEDEIVRLFRPLSRPMGLIDSTTIFVVAPKVSRLHAFRLWRDRLKARLKIKRFHGAFCIPIISPCPEIAFKRLMDHLKHFWDRRIKGFLERFGVQPWQYDYNIRNLISNTYQVIEYGNSQIIHCLKSMVAHLVYFMDRYAGHLELVGKLGDIKRKIEKTAQNLADSLDLLSPVEWESVLARLQECLAVTCVKLRG
jgi:hypothetical protein